MDPGTVIVLLALNLVGIGALLHLIARRMADPAGLRAFGTGALAFGLAYLLRLGMGFSSGTARGILSDTGMIFATLSFAIGLQRFSGAVAMNRRQVVLVLLVYVALAGAATGLWQGVGRHAALNLALGLGYGVLATLAFAAAKREIAPLRLPLRVLAVLVGLLSLATAARGVAVMAVGMQPLFAGPWAQAYYTYSIVVITLIGPNLLWMVFVRLNERLHALATHDALTGLLNRNGLEQVMQRHFASRPPPPLVLLLVDIDHFKRINDEQGHAAGDAVLRSLAQTLKAQVRGGDVVARWGGEEFLICCQGSDPARAPALAERLRLAVQAERHARLDASQGSTDCTVSIGVSFAFNDRSTWEAAARAADDALYQAKREGRNRVVVASGCAAVAAQATRGIQAGA
ncbi:MAG: GGDEF domain-containing protein [Rubrivivax sp.]|nr:GGDEF domain-containing protein [Rubrivivax sp.]